MKTSPKTKTSSKPRGRRRTELTEKVLACAEQFGVTRRTAYRWALENDLELSNLEFNRDDYYRACDIVKMLQVSRSWVYYHYYEGHYTGFKLSDHILLIEKKSFHHFLENAIVGTL